MTTKAEVLRDPMSHLNRAGPNEPVFVLRVRDPNAAQTIRLWAVMSSDAQPVEKIEGAFTVAAEFEKWRNANVPDTPAVVSGAQQAAYNPVPLSIRRGN